MDESPSETDFADAFSSFSDESTPPPEWGTSDEGAESFPGGSTPSLAVEMARLWVKDHQKATMLGAFGVGVFIGVLFRD